MIVHSANRGLHNVLPACGGWVQQQFWLRRPPSAHFCPPSRQTFVCEVLDCEFLHLPAGGCTTCYLMRRAGAAAVLAAVAGGRACRGNVDELMFVDMARRGELQIYDADPPLCDLTFAPTTIKV